MHTPVQHARLAVPALWAAVLSAPTIIVFADRPAGITRPSQMASAHRRLSVHSWKQRCLEINLHPSRAFASATSVAGWPQTRRHSSNRSVLRYMQQSQSPPPPAPPPCRCPHRLTLNASHQSAPTWRRSGSAAARADAAAATVHSRPRSVGAVYAATRPLPSAAGGVRFASLSCSHAACISAEKESTKIPSGFANSYSYPSVCARCHQLPNVVATGGANSTAGRRVADACSTARAAARAAVAAAGRRRHRRLLQGRPA